MKTPITKWAALVLSGLKNRPAQWLIETTVTKLPTYEEKVPITHRIYPTTARTILRMYGIHFILPCR